MDKKEQSYVDALLIFNLWYEFLNDIDAQIDFGKKKCHKKPAPRNYCYL